MGRPKKVDEVENKDVPEITDVPEYINVRLQITEMRPDKRQYNQQTLLLVPYQTWVTVAVPNTKEFVIFGDTFSATVQPDLTPAGLRYVVDQLDGVFEEKKSIPSPSWDDENEKSPPVSTGWDDEDDDTEVDTKVDDKSDDDDEVASDGWEDEKDDETDSQDESWNDETETEFKWED